MQQSNANSNVLWAAPNGQLWYGNAEGLFVFNPKTEQFRNFTHDPNRPDSIRAGEVQRLAGDGHGGIWVGIIGETKGLDHLLPNSDSFEHIAYDPQKSDGIAGDWVRGLMLDHTGRLWVATNGALQRAKPDGHGFERVASDPTNPNSLAGRNIQNLFEASDGKIWMALQGQGVAWLDPNSLDIHYLNADPARSDKLSHGLILGIIQPVPDEIWIATFGGGVNVVSAIDGTVQKRWKHDPALDASSACDYILDMIADSHHQIWLTCDSGDFLLRYNLKQAKGYQLRPTPDLPEGLSQADIQSFLELPDGRLLIGTSSNGIDILDRRRGLIGGYRPGKQKGSLPKAAITVIATSSDGTLWAGTDQAGIWALEPGKSEWINYPIRKGSDGSYIAAILIEHDDQVWVGTEKGLVKWSAKKRRFDPVPTADGKIFEGLTLGLASDGQNRLWVSTDAGIGLVDRDASAITFIRPEQFDPKPCPTNGQLEIDGAGRLIIGGNDGVDRVMSWDGKTLHINHVGYLGECAHLIARGILEDKQGRIYLD